jgi:hypothetical protein
VFSFVLNNRLYSWVENEKKIIEEQAGFSKGYSTTDHIFTLISMIKKRVHDQGNGKLYVCFVDYFKAFDSVNRNSLWSVLQKVKLSTKMIRMLKSMYRTVQSCVRWQADFSIFSDCPSGLKQGCILSSLNFSLLINEVAHAVNFKGKHGFQFLPGLQEFFLLLFADDIGLISTTFAGLQNQIDNLQTASELLGLSVNLDKTKIKVFRKGERTSKKETWFYKGQQIEIVNKYKYLGFTSTTKLSFDLALGEVVGKAKGKVVEILRTMWNLGTADLCMFFKLFDAQVKPMILYASEIWGYLHLHAIETVHMFACKRFLNVNIKTPNIMVYGDLGRFPLYIDSTLYVVRYWFKLQKMALDRIPKQVYIMLLNRFQGRDRDTSERHNWAYAVKRCFDTHGFSHVWIHGGRR